jgi:hypothetical protein
MVCYKGKKGLVPGDKHTEFVFKLDGSRKKELHSVLLNFLHRE